MRLVHLDLSNGASGDMLCAALLGLQPDPQEVLDTLNRALPRGLKVSYERQRRDSLECGRFEVHYQGRTLDELPPPERKSSEAREPEQHSSERSGSAPAIKALRKRSADTFGKAGLTPYASAQTAHIHLHGHDHEHKHSHDHPHDHGGVTHAHRSLTEVLEIIGTLPLPKEVLDHARAVYELLAIAEGRAHGCAVGEVHFHEVGSLDAIADICTCCMCLTKLQPCSLSATPITVGFGEVRCAHGILSVPAPATALLLEGLPCTAGGIAGERCTPTAAALLQHFKPNFTQLPLMILQQSSGGAGSKTFPGCANMLRAYLGVTPEDDGESEQVTLLSCNIDDQSPEELAYACEELLAQGALDVWRTPAVMKKGRLGCTLYCLCRRQHEQHLGDVIFAQTTTLGIRVQVIERRTLPRTLSTVSTPLGELRYKSSGRGFDRVKFEYDDLAEAARRQGVSLSQVRELAQEALKSSVQPHKSPADSK